MVQQLYEVIMIFPLATYKIVTRLSIGKYGLDRLIFFTLFCRGQGFLNPDGVYEVVVLHRNIGFFNTGARIGDIVFSISTDTLLVQDAISEKIKETEELNISLPALPSPLSMPPCLPNQCSPLFSKWETLDLGVGTLGVPPATRATETPQSLPTEMAVLVASL
ncbi:hypothetical protein Taro_023960, partial [Colocasia esculenta]|nr:hypothetical protein [Colocasia esculenta]